MFVGVKKMFVGVKKRSDIVSRTPNGLDRGLWR
jgi:hypothetical protein